MQGTGFQFLLWKLRSPMLLWHCRKIKKCLKSELSFGPSLPPAPAFIRSSREPCTHTSTTQVVIQMHPPGPDSGQKELCQSSGKKMNPVILSRLLSIHCGPGTAWEHRSDEHSSAQKQQQAEMRGITTKINQLLFFIIVRLNDFQKSKGSVFIWTLTVKCFIYITELLWPNNLLYWKNILYYEKQYSGRK